MRRYLTILWAALALVSLLALAAGCGGDDEGEETEEATTATAPAEQTATIEMGDYFFKPDKAALPSGAVEISAPNVGEVEHELVLFKTDEDPADLPVTDGEVDEEALEEAGAEEAGEIEAEAGDTAEGTFELTAGKYAMICNIPGHYERGMYGSVTVK